MYTIHPFKVGALPGITKGEVFTYLLDSDVTLTIPLISYLVRDTTSETVAIIDTGLDPAHVDRAGRTAEGGGPDPFTAELDRHDLTPADVDYVILTHLHYDHAGNNDLFNHAEFFVQRAELEANRDPVPHMERVYFDDIADALTAFDTTIVDGGYRLQEGFELMATPGHTRGQQSILLETTDGPHAIVSDLVYCQHNLEPSVDSIRDANGERIPVTPSDMEYIPPGLHVDTTDCYASYARVRDRIGQTGVMLGGHAGEVLGNTYPA